MKVRALNPHISVDCVLFGFDFERLHVLVIDRKKMEGYPDSKESNQALPGDLIYNDEGLDSGARRVLKDLTGLENIFLEQFGAFGDPNRLGDLSGDQHWLKSLRSQPEERVITIGYYSLVKMEDYHPVASSFASSASWIPVSEIQSLAFDHNLILDRALASLRLTLQTRPVGVQSTTPQIYTRAAAKAFTKLYTIGSWDKRNFRRKILKLGIVKELAEKQQGVAHKPARYFEFDKIRYEELAREGFENFSSKLSLAFSLYLFALEI